MLLLAGAWLDLERVADADAGARSFDAGQPMTWHLLSGHTNVTRSRAGKASSMLYKEVFTLQGSVVRCLDASPPPPPPPPPHPLLWCSVIGARRWDVPDIELELEALLAGSFFSFFLLGHEPVSHNPWQATPSQGLPSTRHYPASCASCESWQMRQRPDALAAAASASTHNYTWCSRHWQYLRAGCWDLWILQGSNALNPSLTCASIVGPQQTMQVVQ